MNRELTKIAPNSSYISILGNRRSFLTSVIAHQVLEKILYKILGNFDDFLAYFGHIFWPFLGHIFWPFSGHIFGYFFGYIFGHILWSYYLAIFSAIFLAILLPLMIKDQLNSRVPQNYD